MTREKTTQNIVHDLFTLQSALLVDLLLSIVGRQSSISTEKEGLEAAWKGYDAWVRLATGTIDNLYHTPLFGETVARSLDAFLRWQRLTNAFTGALSAWMRPAIDLPIGAAVNELHAVVEALREDVQEIKERDPLLSEQDLAFIPATASQTETMNPQIGQEALRALRRARASASPARQKSRAATRRKLAVQGSLA